MLCDLAVQNANVFRYIRSGRYNSQDQQNSRTKEEDTYYTINKYQLRSKRSVLSFLFSGTNEINFMNLRYIYYYTGVIVIRLSDNLSVSLSCCSKCFIFSKVVHSFAKKRKFRNWIHLFNFIYLSVDFFSNLAHSF